MTTIINSFAQGDMLGVVEGHSDAVDRFLVNNFPTAKRGKPRTADANDALVTNQHNIVKVTTYDTMPPETPLGMPQMFDDVAPVANEHGPLGLPKWDFGNSSQTSVNGFPANGTGSDTPNTNNAQRGRQTPLGLPSTL